MSSTTTTSGVNRSSDPLAKLRIERAEGRTGQSRGKRLWRTGLVVILLLAGVCGSSLLATRKGWVNLPANWVAVPELIQTRPEVRLATLSVETGRSADAAVVATGYLESRRQAKIGARAPGRIAQVNVEEGSLVQAGEVLAVLEHADLDASLAAAVATRARAQGELAEHEVTILRAKREFDRAESLRESGTVSLADYDTAKFGHQAAVARRETLQAAVTLADARVREAEQMIANMSVIAPFAGTVISKDAEVGESILPGGMGEASGRGSVVTVADLEHLEVECDVKEDFIGRVHVDQSAEVAVDAVPGRRYDGKVRKILPMGDRARATIKVRVAIANADERLFPDMSATVYFLPADAQLVSDNSQRRIFCASAAIRQDDGGSYVLGLTGADRLQRIDVKRGPTRDDRVEIVEGLTGSEQIVIAPPEVKAGQLVRVVQ